jgi:hypothetical protein
MKTEVYTINKGVNRAIVFRGLEAQYIWWLGGGVAALLVVFATLYILGINPYLCLGIITLAGIVFIRGVYAMSRKYGRYGWMKKSAAKRLPHRIRNATRKCFLPASRLDANVR